MQIKAYNIHIKMSSYYPQIGYFCLLWQKDTVKLFTQSVKTDSYYFDATHTYLISPAHLVSVFSHLFSLR